MKPPTKQAAAILGRGRAQRGAAALETAIFVPLLVFLALAGTYTVRVVLDYNHLNQLSQTGVRYATHAGLDPTRPTEYRFRPTPEEVEAYVQDAADLPLSGVDVTPDPTTIYPGTEVTVTVRTHRDLGVVGGTVNALAWLVGAGPVFPGGGVDLASTAVMREE